MVFEFVPGSAIEECLECLVAGFSFFEGFEEVVDGGAVFFHVEEVVNEEESDSVGEVAVGGE